jgi:CreA protein
VRTGPIELIKDVRCCSFVPLLTLSKDLPSQSPSQVDRSKAGEEVFSEARNLFFKDIKIRRVYDGDAKALVYVSYSTRFDKNSDANKSRFKSSLCTLPLDATTE